MARRRLYAKAKKKEIMRNITIKTDTIDWEVTKNKVGSTLRVTCPLCGKTLINSIENSELASEILLASRIRAIVANHVDALWAEGATGCTGLVFLTGVPTAIEFESIVRGFNGKLWLWKEWLDKTRDLHCEMKPIDNLYLANEIAETVAEIAAQNEYLQRLQMLRQELGK